MEDDLPFRFLDLAVIYLGWILVPNGFAVPEVFDCHAWLGGLRFHLFYDLVGIFLGQNLGRLLLLVVSEQHTCLFPHVPDQD
jgi:hypothetical protein